MTTFERFCLTFALGLCCAAARAEGTDNHVLNAVPAPGRVTINGSFDDWEHGL